MGKTVTFSFRSTNYEDTAAKETFTFEKLGINEGMDDKALMKAMEGIFQAWVWDKLNLSYSIVINEDDVEVE